MKKSLTVIAALALIGTAAQAHLVDEGYYLWPASDPKDTLPELEDLTGLDLTYLAKNNRDGGTLENGAITYANHFTVSYSADGKSATLTWDLNDVEFDLRYVLIKDGIPNGNSKYYHLYSVTESQYKEDIQGASVVFNVAGEPTAGETQREISHISFYGVPSQAVPDGGLTLAMLGVGILSLGVITRRQK